MIKVKMDKLKIDPSFFDFRKAIPNLKIAMSDILDRHASLADRRRQPDGSPQKNNSGSYRRRKNNPGIKVGSRRQRGSIPTILTGDMYASRSISVRGNTIESKFEGSSNGITNATKASHLVGMGYDIHYYGPKDVEIVEKAAEKFMSDAAEKALKVERGT